MPLLPDVLYRPHSQRHTFYDNIPMYLHTYLLTTPESVNFWVFCIELIIEKILPLTVDMFILLVGMVGGICRFRLNYRCFLLHRFLITICMNEHW